MSSAQLSLRMSTPRMNPRAQLLPRQTPFSSSNRIGKYTSSLCRATTIVFPAPHHQPQDIVGLIEPSEFASICHFTTKHFRQVLAWQHHFWASDEGPRRIRRALRCSSPYLPCTSGGILRGGPVRHPSAVRAGQKTHGHILCVKQVGVMRGRMEHSQRHCHVNRMRGVGA